MSLAICVFLAWIVMIILSLMPKKLTEIEMIFLFFVNTIFQLSIFTILHVNLKWLTVSHEVEKSFSSLVFRLLLVPIVFNISANLMLSPSNTIRWVGHIIIYLFLVGIQWMLEEYQVVAFHQWSVLHTLLLLLLYTLFSRMMIWFIVKAGKKEVRKT